MPPLAPSLFAAVAGGVPLVAFLVGGAAARRRRSPSLRSCSRRSRSSALAVARRPGAPRSARACASASTPRPSRCSRPDDPAQDVYRAAVRDFGDDEVYVIAMETRRRLHRRELSSACAAISDAIERLPGVRHVQSLVDVTSFRWDARRSSGSRCGRLIEDVPVGSGGARGAARARARESALPPQPRLRGRPHRGAERLVPQDDGSRVHRRRSRRAHRRDPRRRERARACASTWRAART